MLSFFSEALNMQYYIFLNVRMMAKTTYQQDHANKLLHNKNTKNFNGC